MRTVATPPAVSTACDTFQSATAMDERAWAGTNTRVVRLGGWCAGEGGVLGVSCRGCSYAPTGENGASHDGGPDRSVVVEAAMTVETSELISATDGLDILCVCACVRVC